MIVFETHYYTKQRLPLVIDLDNKRMTSLQSARHPDTLWLNVIPLDFEDTGVLGKLSPEFWEWVPDQ